MSKNINNLHLGKGKIYHSKQKQQQRRYIRIIGSFITLILIWKVILPLLLYLTIVERVKRRIIHDILSYTYISINTLTFVLYGFDKLVSIYFPNNSKIRRSWRISEHALYIFTIFGGTCAAFISMELFYHKTNKPSFYKNIQLIASYQIICTILFTATSANTKTAMWK
jgi:uncharacterized membrane protein YsdA (DUF1294 family)